ncbi:MAG: DUF2868 domain-containing protein [Psychromonas sp.]
MATFEQRLLAEGVRIIEEETPELSVDTLDNQSVSFEQLLLQRSQLIDKDLDISSLFSHFKSATRTIFFIFSLLFMFIGALAVQKVFLTEQGGQINFFWAFALFFIPNLFSLLFWLFFFLPTRRLNANWLIRISQSLLNKSDKYFNKLLIKNVHYRTLLAYYFKLFFSGEFGRFQLSYFTHLLWFSYFTGSVLMLLSLLATHQVDFIWQTSILSAQSFQWLTEFLAYIPSLLGFPVPNLLQIEQSNIAHFNILNDPENARLVWSSLLISSLVIYGLLPRLLLMLVMKLLLRVKTNKFRLNLSLPYYVQLRQYLKPNFTSLGVVDSDIAEQTVSPIPEVVSTSSVLPSDIFPVAIELPIAALELVKKHLDNVNPSRVTRLMHALDYDSQQTLLSSLEAVKEPSIAIYVALGHLPDRGVLSFIKSLTSATTKDYYLLLVNEKDVGLNQLKNRRSDWYSLASQANIPLDNIIQLNIKNGKTHES